MIIVPSAPHDDGRYLAALGSCFERWGGQAEFDWYFRRPSAGGVAERFVVVDHDEWIAGSAVSWREVTEEDGTPRRVGIMTGSWTLPAARGRGCFTAMIEHSREICVQRGADWLLAFVTQDNASRRLLERAGSMMIPTEYLWSAEGAEPPATDHEEKARLVEPTQELLEALWARHTELGEAYTRFCYSDPGAWAGQLVERPLPTEFVRVDGVGEVLVERHPTFDRILSSLPLMSDGRLELARVVWARALRAGRRFFAFTTLSEDAAWLRRSCGLAGTAGFMTLLPAASPLPAGGLIWRVESGDRV